MTGFRLSPLARADLDDIWGYTAETWGQDQAEVYLRAIQHAIQRAAAEPKSGQDCGYVRAGYRRARAGSHFIFYVERGDVIEIMRVLHERMDVAARL